MASNSKKLMVIGGRGVLAPLLVKYLSGKPEYEISVLCRPSSEVQVPPKVNIVRSDFSYPSLLDAFRGQKLAVDMVASMPVPARKILIDAIVDAGVERLIPGEFSSNMENPAMIALWEMHGDRVEIRKYLREKASQKPSFSWTTVTVGPFYDWCLKVGFMRYNLDTKTATIFDQGTKPFCATSLKKTCDVVHAVFQHIPETKNRVLYVSSFTTTQNEVLGALQKATGTKWTVQRFTTKAEMAKAREKLSRGDQYGQMDLLLSAIYAPEFGSDWSDAARESDKILELVPEDLQVVTQEIVDGKRPDIAVELGLLAQM